MGYLEDSQVRFRVPETLLREIKQSLDLEILEDAPELVKKALECPAKGKNVYLEDLSWMHSKVKNKANFHEWLRECSILLPRVKPLPRNPELEARILKLKAQQADREYQKMTKNIDSSRVRLPDDTIGSQIKQINQQLIAVAQFVFSVAAGFMFGFMGIDLMVGEQDTGFRLLLGVICALIIALAEIYFLAKKLAEVVTPPLNPPSQPSAKPPSEPSAKPPSQPSAKVHRD